LTTWEIDAEGNLVGTLELPMAVGLVGGATKVNPVSQVAVRILGVKSAVELGEIVGAVGLAQNLAALRVLATEGVQRGHMSLHANNIAVIAGATGNLIDEVAKRLVEEKKIRVDRAKEILEELKKK
jgi:hydroxymethylglutaryl-CoA reductase